MAIEVRVLKEVPVNHIVVLPARDEKGRFRRVEDVLDRPWGVTLGLIKNERGGERYRVRVGTGVDSKGEQQVTALLLGGGTRVVDHGFNAKIGPA